MSVELNINRAIGKLPANMRTDDMIVLLSNLGWECYQKGFREAEAEYGENN